MPAAGAHAFGERALWVEFEFELARQILAHEFRVLANAGRDHLLDLAGLQQQAEAEIVDARVVRGDGEVLGARIADRRDQKLRDAAQAEPAGGVVMPSSSSPSRRFPRRSRISCSSELPFASPAVWSVAWVEK